MNKTYRTAKINDIPAIMEVRLSVKENRLSDPTLVTAEDCAHYMQVRGKAWVCELDGEVKGFAIVDLTGCKVWALFVHPGAQKMGIGTELHRIMLDGYFSRTRTKLTLGTDPGTRAETFYRKKGWKPTGRLTNGEKKFEMTFAAWQAQNAG